MNVLLVAGKFNHVLYSKIAYKKHIINKQDIYSSQIEGILDKETVRFDKIVILDEGIDQSIDDLLEVIEYIEHKKGLDSIIIITYNLEMKFKLGRFIVYFGEKIRATTSFYYECFDQVIEEKVYQVKSPQKKESRENKGFIFGKVFGRNKVREESQKEDRRFNNISKGINRVIGITGHRGVGITSTVVNIAHEASKHKLNTIIIDLDIYNRTSNLYFSEFIRQAEADEYLRGALLKCLARPQDYKNNICYIREKLWLASLSYDFDDKKLITQLYTENKLINMLAVLRQYFNVILLDIPFDILGNFKDSIPNIDVFGLCTHNSQYSILTNLRNMETYLPFESMSYLNAKSKLIITQYNDRAQYDNDFFTPERVSEIYDSDLCEELSIRMPIAGSVRYTNDFDEQIENDIPIAERNSEYKNYYSNILLRLLEVVE